MVSLGAAPGITRRQATRSKIILPALSNIFQGAPRPPDQAPRRPKKQIMDLCWPLTRLKLTGPAQIKGGGL